MYDRSKFYQGEDIKFDFYILDANNVRIDLAQFTDIVLYIYNPADKDCTMLKISKVARTGYIPLYLPTGATDETSYRAIIDSAITTKLTPGQYVIEINVTVDDAEVVADDRFNRIGKAKAFKIERAITKWESRTYDATAWYPYDHDRTVDGYQAHWDLDPNGIPYGHSHGHHHHGYYHGGGLW